ncbi:MAG: hypothetical protein M1829_001432 [Trizodia sp. TS-e1964]|nr:MAG: hypothetical protein M1829_001432 [Trizodia sp. TS-e1964]
MLRSSIGANQSLVMDMARMNIRHATPDSEALASSDDELDNQQTIPDSLSHASHTGNSTSHNVTQTNDQRSVPTKPVRRSSWLNDLPLPTLSGQRKGSFVIASSLASSTAPMTSLSADAAGTWATANAANNSSGPALSRQFPGTAPLFSQGNIWNNEARGKELPSRLTEVLPSPTSVISPAFNSHFADKDETTAMPQSRDHIGVPNIPFPIPLHPTPKTYRSQSYSVGQTDPESNGGLSHALPSTHFGARVMPNQPSGLQHRPSRPSLLNEESKGSVLGKLREVDGDDESNESSSQQGVNMREYDSLSMDAMRRNPQLRYSPLDASTLGGRARIRAASTAAIPFSAFNTVLAEDEEYAIDEADDVNELQGFPHNTHTARRFSDFSSPVPDNMPLPAFSATSLENRKLESIKKGHWTSSLGFGGVEEGSQSRRHSFANVRARNESLDSGIMADSLPSAPPASSFINPPYNSSPTAEMGLGLTGRNDLQARFPDLTTANAQPESEYRQFHDALLYFYNYSLEKNQQIAEEALKVESLHDRVFATGYFQGPIDSGLRYSPAGIPGASGPFGQVGHHRGPYGMPPNISGMQRQSQSQLLYVVSFKCCRADVFYIQEGTGLEVKPGDLVVVDADRGMDLGTVVSDCVSWAKAKEVKDGCNAEHSRWLLAFSRQQNSQNTGVSNGMLASSHPTASSAVGGMGPPGLGQQAGQEANASELKPKMIKRLASTHEVAGLKEKEGSEAKAKRMCQQKVAEHSLNMEILDAEYQVDWKKLTFFYFADSYINFNSLVTDLFKLYKTRIWMSAINPASFATPSLGLQAPLIAGPGAVGNRRASPYDQNRQRSQHGQVQLQSLQQPGFPILQQSQQSHLQLHQLPPMPQMPPNFIPMGAGSPAGMNLPPSLRGYPGGSGLNGADASLMHYNSPTEFHPSERNGGWMA